MRRLGLIGGTSWESSAHYYAQLNRGVRDRLGGVHSADLVLRSVDFAEVTPLQEAGDWAALGTRYRREAAALVEAGAEVIGILANTMHMLVEDVESAGVPVVHVVDAVARAAVGRGVRTVGLLGTRYTMSSSVLYPSRMAEHDVAVVVPSEPDADEVHRIIYEELVRGVVSDASRQRLRAVVADLAGRGAGAVVLGCTELPMLLDPADPGDALVPLLDSTALHVDALLDAALAPPVSNVLTEAGAA